MKGVIVMIEKIKVYLSQFFWDNPEKYQNDFKNKINIKNLQRMKFILIFFTCFISMVFVFQFLKNPYTISFYFETITMVISFILTYIYFKIISSNINNINSNHKILFYLTLIFILTWAVIRSGYFHFDNVSLFIYIFTTFFISTIFYFKWKIYLPLFAVTTVAILILNYIFGLNYINIFSRALLLLNIYIFGFIISRINYISLMRKLLKIKEIEGKYKNIIDKNKRLENILDDKKSINNDLRNQIDELKENLSFALKKAETGLWEWDIENGKIVYNKEWAQILDYHVNKLDGRLETWRDLIHIEDKGKFDDFVNKIKSGKKEEIKFEHRLKTGKGNWKWMLAYGKVVEKNEEGEAVKMLGIHKNIDFAKNIENRLQQNKKSFKNIFDSLPFAILIYNNNEWQFINDEAEKLLLYSSQELLGTSNWGFIDSDYLRLIKREKNKDRRKFHDLKIIDKKGNEKLVDFYAGKVNINSQRAVILAAKKK